MNFENTISFVCYDTRKNVFTCRYIRQKPVFVARQPVDTRHNRFAGHGTRGAPCALWFVAGNRLSLRPSNIVQPRRMTMFRGDNRIFHNPSSSTSDPLTQSTQAGRLCSEVDDRIFYNPSSSSHPLQRGEES